MKRRILAPLVVFMCLLTPVAGLRAEDRALLVGVGRYADPRANLPGIDRDLEMMKEVVRMAGFKDDQVKVLRDSDATLSEIESAVRSWLINGVTIGDRALFYFSGHGSQIPDTNNDESDRADEVLVPHDVRPSGDTLVNTFVDERFGQLLAEIDAGEILVFIDACHSGTATKGLRFAGDEMPKLYTYQGMPAFSKGNFSVEEDLPENTYVALSACKDNQTAVATRQGSLFTRGLLDAAKEAHRNNRPLTMAVLRDKATQYIHRNASSPSKRHDPQISGDEKLAKTIEIIRRREDARPPETASLWDQLESLVDRADHKIDIRTNKERFRKGDLLVISCDVDKNGYLNILEVSPEDEKATVLFPNRFQQENYVTAGNRVSIPGQGDTFRLRSTKRGKSLIVVFQTDQKINAFNDGEGKATDLFKMMSGATRSVFEVEAAEQEHYFGAGKFITVVE